MRKLLLGSAAVLLTGAVALAANLPFFSGPIDPSNFISNFNGYVQTMNSALPGMVANQSGPTASIATTAVQTLATTPIATGTLNAPGQTLRLRCWGSTPANGDNKWVSLVFGSTTVTSGQFSTSSELWQLDLQVTAVTATANYMAVGGARLNNTLAGMVSQQVTSDNLASGLTASCNAQQGTSIAADVLLLGFTVEQMK